MCPINFGVSTYSHYQEHNRDVDFLKTQINPISYKVANFMNIHQHLITLRVKHILNIREVSIENRKSKVHNK